MMNPNWAKWIYASSCKYFSDGVGNAAKFFGENDVKDVTTLDHWVEFYLDGPDIVQVDKDEWQLTWGITIAIVFIQSQNLGYAPQILEGLIQSLFEGYNLYKYGTTDEDTNLYFDCCNLSGKIKTRRLGQPGIGLRVLQSMVEAKFTVNLLGDV